MKTMSTFGKSTIIDALGMGHNPVRKQGGGISLGAGSIFKPVARCKICGRPAPGCPPQYALCPLHKKTIRF